VHSGNDSIMHVPAGMTSGLAFVKNILCASSIRRRLMSCMQVWSQSEVEIGGS
jgi:hypothetical protein